MVSLDGADVVAIDDACAWESVALSQLVHGRLDVAVHRARAARWRASATEVAGVGLDDAQPGVHLRLPVAERLGEHRNLDKRSAGLLHVSVSCPSYLVDTVVDVTCGATVQCSDGVEIGTKGRFNSRAPANDAADDQCALSGSRGAASGEKPPYEEARRTPNILQSRRRRAATRPRVRRGPTPDDHRRPQQRL